MPGQALYPENTALSVTHVVKSCAQVILYVYEEKQSLTFKETVHGVCLLSKALGCPAILLSVDTRPDKPEDGLLIFAQQCVVVESLYPMPMLTPVQKATLEELQQEQVIQMIEKAQPLLSTVLDPRNSAVES